MVKDLIIGIVILLSGLMVLITYSLMIIGSKCSREEEKLIDVSLCYKPITIGECENLYYEDGYSTIINNGKIDCFIREN